jgi:predicted nucleotidyltransferase
MKENGTPPAGNTRFRVVVDLYDEVIEMIVPHQAVATLVEVESDGAIVVSV